MRNMGICIDELAWIERDQFVYFATIAFMLGDPSDWPSFRQDMLAALVAAGLQPRWLTASHVGAVDPADLPPQRQEATLGLLDEVRSQVDPAGNWEGCLQVLWVRFRES